MFMHCVISIYLMEKNVFLILRQNLVCKKSTFKFCWQANRPLSPTQSDPHISLHAEAESADSVPPSDRVAGVCGVRRRRRPIEPPLAKPILGSHPMINCVSRPDPTRPPPDGRLYFSV